MGIGRDFPVAVALKLDAPGVCSGWLIELGHLWIQCILRWTKRCAVERDTTDKLRVTNRDHRRGVGTVAFPEEVCFRDAEKFQQTDTVVGIPLEGERALRNGDRSAKNGRAQRREREWWAE